MSGWAVDSLDFDTTAEPVLRAAHDLVQRIARESLPDEEEPFGQWVSRYRIRESWVRWRWWVATGAGGEVIGFAHLRLSDADNLDQGWGWVGVDAEHRRQGVGSALLREVARGLLADGRSLLSMDTVKGVGGEELLGRYGLEEKIVELHNRTHLADIDRSMLEEWVRRRQERAADYELRVWEGPAPADLIEAFAAARAVMNTAPLDDLDYDDEIVTRDMQREIDEVLAARGYEWVTMAAVAPDGSVAGYTQMTFSRWRPELAEQEDTGVDPAHRNRGIGRWLKAAMLLKVLDERPAVRMVDTGNAASNGPMLGINRALGFRPVERWAGWQAPVERVLKELEAKL